MKRDSTPLPTPTASAEVDAFLKKLAETPAGPRSEGRGRLVFAMDATASREPTWDTACHIQAEMFEETRNLGGLDVQLCYYRGFRELVASPWVSDPAALRERMTGVTCAAGHTQIIRVLEHARSEALAHRVNALVFVGDCMEEDIGALQDAAGRLGLVGVPAFMFHEGFDPVAGAAFRDVARLTRGAYTRFDAGSAQQLRDLLAAVAVYASGGRDALARLGERRGGIVRLLSHQVAKT
jgi:hypothetical protein